MRLLLILVAGLMPASTILISSSPVNPTGNPTIDPAISNQDVTSAADQALGAVAVNGFNDEICFNFGGWECAPLKSPFVLDDGSPRQFALQEIGQEPPCLVSEVNCVVIGPGSPTKPVIAETPEPRELPFLIAGLIAGLIAIFVKRKLS